VSHAQPDAVDEAAASGAPPGLPAVDEPPQDAATGAAIERGGEGRVERAETRTKEAEARADRANTRSTQADTRTEQAETRTKEAEARTTQANTRSSQADTRTQQAEARTKEAEARTEQANTRSTRADTRTEQAEMRTERAESSEEALRASELSYRRLFEAARDGILMLDVRTGRIEDVNPFLLSLLAVSRGEMIGKTVAELGLFTSIESNGAMLSKIEQHGYVRYEDLPLETRDGRQLAVEFVSNAYQVGDLRVIQCNIRDITQRKLAEDEIRRLNEELEAFSQSVSHDLRAPLRHVIGFVALLERDLGPTLGEKDRHNLTNISSAASRMGVLIDDLLAFARIGRAELKRTNVDLDDLLQDVRGEFEAETKGRSIAWRVRPLPRVRGDRSLLRLVLVNLVSNALKFTAGRERAEIEIGPVASDHGSVVFSIRDNGAGFDPKYSSKLFGVFQRLHSQTEFEGTGIGLANVKRIVHRHGGRVWAEGEVDHGATFYVSIPSDLVVPKSMGGSDGP